MSGGGSGGGGGSSGTIDYPDYMKWRHANLYDWMKDEVWKAQANNPYLSIQAWSPVAMTRKMQAAVDCYDGIIRKFEPLELWKSLMGEIPQVVIGLIDNGPLDDYIDSQKKSLQKSVEQEILPKYRRGMQDINAVMTSSFKIGEALIWCDELEKEVNLEKEFKGKLALAAYEYSFKSTGDIIQLTLQKIAYHKEVLHYFLEVWRMEYTAMKEYTDSYNVYEIEKVKWNLEMYKYLMDSLGSIASSAGTSYTTSSSGTSKTSSAIGGALAGAGTGAMAGSVFPGYGTAIGAAAGGALGLIGGLFG